MSFVAHLVLLCGSTASRVALVTGASRGIGRGIAVELGRRGMTVYVLGRSSRARQSSGDALSEDRQLSVSRATSELDLTVESAAEAVTSAGGRGRPLPCDCGDDIDIERALQEVADTEGRLDVLVCSAYSTPPGKLRGPFWEQPMSMWDAVNGVGLRGVYATCRAATPLMIQTATSTERPPLICLISSFGGKSYTFNVAYGVGKAAVDRLARDMAYQLADSGVATVSLYPGLVRTEANLQMERDGTWEEASGGLDLSDGETPGYSGKALAALIDLEPSALLARSGNVEVVAELAKELDFREEDGTQPPSIRSLQYLLPNFVFPTIEKQAGKPVPEWVRQNVPDLLLPWSVFSGGAPPEPEQ